ncbi:MAG: substrate-binding domain-containing protein [Pseudomonadota bacterium]
MTDRPVHKAPTLKTIADMTGLSLSTVSLSLRDGSKLKKETRDRVARAAAELGYVPNRAGVRLRTGQTNVLTLILSTERNTLDYTRLLIQGIGAHLQRTPYHLNVTPELPGNDPLDSLNYILTNRTSDGVILTHTSTHDVRVQRLADAGLPFVTHGRTTFDFEHAYVDFHAERFIELAVDRLLALGRTRFLYVPFDNGTTNFNNTVAQFKSTVSARGLDGDVVLDTRRLDTAASAREFACNLALSASPPDAIICSNDVTAVAVLGGMTDAGKHCGDDFNLVCKGTTELLPALYPQIDTVREDLVEAGRHIAELLIQRLRGIDVANLQKLHKPTVSWGNS